MPYFRGCETLISGSEIKHHCSDQELVRFLSRHLEYPEEAKQTRTEGTVYVSFIVDEHGKVQNPVVLKDIGHHCGEAALRVLAEMPLWEPGLQDGQKVKVKLNLPVQFYLNAPEKEAEPYSLTWGALRGDTTTTEELLNTLSLPIFVRDPQGNNRYIDELAFTYKKNKRLVNATSRGSVSGELSRVVEKTRKGGIFTITASVQDKGRFVYVSRSFKVVE
jgi:TonB family protein